MHLLPTQPAVEVQDAGGNIIHDWVGKVNVSIRMDGTPFHPALPPNGAAQLLGATDAYLYEGVAYFWNLKLDEMGRDFTLRFEAEPALSEAESAPFSVFGEHATALRILTLPSAVRATLAMPSVVVAAVDDNGNADGAFLPPLHVALLPPPGRNVSLITPSGVSFVDGVAVLTHMQLSGASSQLRLSLTAGTLSLVSDPFDAIDVFTGWWHLNFRARQMLFSLRRSLFDTVSAVWHDEHAGLPGGGGGGGDMAFSSRYSSVVDLAGGCISATGVVSADSAETASYFLGNCGEGVIRGESAGRVDAGQGGGGMYGTDVEALVVHEHYPEDAVKHFVLVANRYNGSTFTTQSSLFLWNAGRLELYQEFPGTKGAHAWTHYVIGGVHYLIVANHFDDAGNGYGVPSLIYAYSWDADANKRIFAPIQSLSASGAVAWEHFAIDGEDYLAVANYFNGSHFDIPSKVYHLPRTGPDTPSIRTVGARDVKHFTAPSGLTHHIAFANRWGGTVSIFTWDAALHRFAPSVSINSAGAMSLAPFSHAGDMLLAVVNVPSTTTSHANKSAVFRLGSDMSGFSKVQDLPTAGASYVKLLANDGERALLAVANVHDAALSTGSSDVYRWDGARFQPYLVLPTRHAYAVTVADIPCLTSSVDGTACGARATERVVLAVNGRGGGVEVFQLLSFNATSVATHLRAISHPPGDTAIGNATFPFLTPATTVQLMRFDAPSESEWDLPILAGAFVWEAVVAVGGAEAREVGLQGVTSLALNASGMATFSQLVTTTAGTLSVRLYNHYLNDVTMALTRRLTVTPGRPAALRVEWSSRVLPSGEPYSALVSVNDEFFNFQPAHAAISVEGGVYPGTRFTLSNSTVRAAGGKALFTMGVVGSSSGHRVSFSSPGLTSAVSPTFSIESPVWVYPVPFHASVLPGATLTPRHRANTLLLFGGLTPTGASNGTVEADYATSPPSYSVFPVGGAVPAARYDHIAVSFPFDGRSVMLVHGGTNGTRTFASAHVLDTATRVWSPVDTQTGQIGIPAGENPAGIRRARHAGVHAVISQPDPLQPWLTEVFSLVLVFGGVGDDGRPLASLEILRVYSHTIVRVPAGSVIQTGPAPAPRFDLSMTWLNARGYVLGGHAQDDTIYSFTVAFNGESFIVAWSVLSPQSSGAAGRERHVSVSTAMVFDAKLFFLARDSSVGSENAAVVLDVSAGAALAWEDTTLRAGSAPVTPYSRVVALAPGKFLVVSSDVSGRNTSSWVVSLVASYSLSLAPFLPSAAAAGETLRPQPVVTILDANGHAVAYDVSAFPVPLGGTSSRPAINGIATFTDLSVDKDVWAMRIVFRAASLFPSAPTPLFAMDLKALNLKA
ncbi:hypothetical protein T484DRAFT_1823912 [Baffinella frigidus]|nr:hypothetical protein T484DRAFT_1823912 [Cryptophyta sp. CCMP2293]